MMLENAVRWNEDWQRWEVSIDGSLMHARDKWVLEDMLDRIENYQRAKEHDE